MAMARMPCTSGRNLPVAGRGSRFVACEEEAPVGLWWTADCHLNCREPARPCTSIVQCRSVRPSVSELASQLTMLMPPAEPWGRW